MLERQLKGVPEYSDMYWNGCVRNQEQNKARLAEQRLPECVSCFNKAAGSSDAFVACLYEYYLAYDVDFFAQGCIMCRCPCMCPMTHA